MSQPSMVQETKDLMRQAIEENVETSILIDNRAGGNAPIITQRVAAQFMENMGS
jgi:hypothetical protein